jgi:hypothetical protein
MMRVLKAKRFRVLLLLMAIFCLAFLTLRPSQPRPEPSYDGQTLTQCLHMYLGLAHMTAETFTPDRLNDEDTTKAIRAMGTNCIPSLLEMMDAPEVPHADQINRVLSRLPGITYRIRDPGSNWIYGTFGFVALDTMGNSAEPELLKILKSNHGTKSRFALLGLAAVSTNKHLLLPLLLKDYNDHHDYMIAWYLHKRFPEEAEKAGVYKLFPKYQHPQFEVNSTNGASTNAGASQ